MQQVEKKRLTKAEASSFNRLKAGRRKRESVTIIVKRTLYHAGKELEKDLSAFRTMSPAREGKEEDDCSIASELVALDSFEESLRQELAEAEDLWRISERSIEKSISADDGSLSDEDSDEDNPGITPRTSNATVDPAPAFAPLSPAQDSSESSGENDNESDSQEVRLKNKSIQDLLSAALLYTGDDGGMSLALASDILASQIYAQDSILLAWLHRNLPSYHSSKSWLYGVPVLGSATSNGQLLFLKNDELDRPFGLDENFGEIDERFIQ